MEHLFEIIKVNFTLVVHNFFSLIISLLYDVHLHACSSHLLTPLVDGRVNNVLLHTGRASINQALLQLINVFHTTFV